MSSKDLEELLKIAQTKVVIPKSKLPKEMNHVEYFVRVHKEFSRGEDLISAKYIYDRYYRWTIDLKHQDKRVERRWFFRLFSKIFKKKEFNNGTYYYLDSSKLRLTPEEHKLYAKKSSKKESKKKSQEASST